MSGFAFRHPIDVRFRDCDSMGHVNHAVYLTFVEQCRLMFWRELTGGPKPRTSVIVARVECDYRAPAYFGERLEVGLNVARIGQSSFDLVYEIVNVASSQKVADARTVMVSYDYTAGKPVPLPPDTRALLEQWMARR
jgi:acyl-CoA thioester hydrolase